MSTLTDAFEARFSTQRVLEWTQPDNPSATTKDATRLGYAGTDAEARFKVEVGVAFDATDARHLQACIPGVRAFLLLYLDQDAGKKALDQWITDHLKPLSKVTGRDRLAPRTDSLLVPTIEGATGTVRPAFDHSTMSDVLLDNPADGQGSSDGFPDD